MDGDLVKTVAALRRVRDAAPYEDTAETQGRPVITRGGSGV
jgi:hypothetical protein